MEIIDWTVVGSLKRGEFTLRFDVSTYDEDAIRKILNHHIKAIQITLEELEVD